MNSQSYRFEITLLLLILSFAPTESYGYIDPSSGYILWQMLFGIILGGLFFAKRIWMGIKGLFSKDKSSDSIAP